MAIHVGIREPGLPVIWPASIGYIHVAPELAHRLRAYSCSYVGSYRHVLVSIGLDWIGFFLSRLILSYWRCFLPSTCLVDEAPHSLQYYDI